MNKKLLILDGLSELALARDFMKACSNIGLNVSYIDLAQLPKKRLYVLSNFILKLKKLLHIDSKGENFKSVKYRNEKLIEQIRKYNPSHILVFRYLYKFIDPSLIQRITKTTGAKIYLYDTDSCNLFPNSREFSYFIDNELIIYDEIFSFSKVAANFFLNTKKLKASFFPYGSNRVDQSPDKEKDIDVLFVGRASFRRIFLLEKIKDFVTIYGNRWEKSATFLSDGLKKKIVNKTVWDDNLLDLIQRSKIVLNITNGNFYSVETGLNLRVFEALAAGSFLLTDYYSEIEDLFEIGVELDTFASSEELKSKVEYYLSNEVEMRKIALAGMRKFNQSFSWEKRALEMSERIGLI